MSNWNEGLGKTVIDLRLEEGWVAKAMDYAKEAMGYAKEVMGYAKEVMGHDGFASDEEEIIIGVAASIAGMAARVVNDFEDAEHFRYVLARILGVWDLSEAAQGAMIERIYNMGQEMNDIADAKIAEGIVAARGN